MKKAIAVMLMAVLCAVSAPFAQDGGKPRIAVYMTGGKTASEDNRRNTTVMSEFSRRGLFRPIERGEAFQDVVAKEVKKQMDGSVDRTVQICKAGKQSKAQYVCIGEVTSADGETQISTRVLDVETMEAIAMGVVEVDTDNLKESEIAKHLKTAVDRMEQPIMSKLERIK